MSVLTRLRTVYDEVAVDTSDPDTWSEWLPIHAMLCECLPDNSSGRFVWHDVFGDADEAEEAMLRKRAEYETKLNGVLAQFSHCPRCSRS